MIQWNRVLYLMLLLAAPIGAGSGCGSEDPGFTLEPVSGTVLMDNKPLANAVITFQPMGATPGIGGQSRTDEEGKFQVLYGRGGEGLPEGEYRVAVSLRIMPDGSPAPADENVDPIESPARETLPPKYSNIERSELKVDVKQGQPIELKLTK